MHWHLVARLKNISRVLNRVSPRSFVSWQFIKHFDKLLECYNYFFCYSLKAKKCVIYIYVYALIQVFCFITQKAIHPFIIFNSKCWNLFLFRVMLCLRWGCVMRYLVNWCCITSVYGARLPVVVFTTWTDKYSISLSRRHLLMYTVNLWLKQASMQP